jgi:chaperonin GroES
MNKFRPLYERILVRRASAPDKTPGGLYVPDSAKKKIAEGEVLAVGKGKMLPDGSLRELDVKPGQRVVFGEYSGAQIKLDEELVVLREDDILGVFE